jgi:hypothetical protein
VLSHLKKCAFHARAFLGKRVGKEVLAVVRGTQLARAKILRHPKPTSSDEKSQPEMSFIHSILREIEVAARARREIEAEANSRRGPQNTAAM